jgi:hypothetical protein
MDRRARDPFLAMRQILMRPATSRSGVESRDCDEIQSGLSRDNYSGRLGSVSIRLHSCPTI